jgi:two-component system NtrC family sensor kinase
MILTVDRSGRILTWNRGATEIYGYPKEEVVGEAMDILVPEDRRREAADLLGRVLDGETIRDYETVRLQRSGVKVDVVMTLSPLKDPDGNIVGVSSLGKDVTRRKKLQQQLLQAEKMAAIGQLISGVAHELNNPLTSVIGYSQLVATERTGEKTAGYLDRIASEGMRCQRIVHNLLTFARSHNSEKRPMDVNEALRATMELREYELRVNDVEVAMELSRDLPWTFGDYHQLQQVFMNIITNAQQAMAGRGPGRLEIRTSQVERDDGGLRQPVIRVEFLDTGPGVPEAIRSKIFDPFFTSKDVGMGTGLGLSLSYGIVQEHGGQIYSVPREGGAHFVVDLPVRGGAEAAALAVRAEGEAEREEGGAARILVVDDEPTVREMLRDVLAPEGHRVDLAENGRTALEKLGGASYDLIIADLKMPEFNGTELYRALRQRDPSLARKILFATGDVISADTKAFLEETGNAYISKPFGVQEIRDRVRTFLVGTREDA